MLLLMTGLINEQNNDLELLFKRYSVRAKGER